ncbi:Dysferlin [Orobanche gracilis]
MVPEVGSDDDDEVTEKGTKLYISNLIMVFPTWRRVPNSSSPSSSGILYGDECEAAINEKINVENNISYVYHSLFAYFDWEDNIILKFFKESSDKEREHAEKLMKYQVYFVVTKAKVTPLFLSLTLSLQVCCRNE